MDRDEVRRLRREVERYRDARPRFHRAIYAALRAGVTVSELVAETGYNREHIRRIRVQGEEGTLS